MSTREQTYRINTNENNKKKEKNSSYTKNKNLLNYWDKKKEKSKSKLDKIRKELYNKEFNEVRKTPRINSNSKKIVKKILYINENVNKNNSEIKNLNINKSNSNNKICLTDYNTIFSNRMKKNFNRPQTLKKGINHLNFQNKSKPIIKEEKKNNFYGYLRYDPDKVNDVRHKVHNIFDSKSKNDSYRKLYENYVHYKNTLSQNPINQNSEINNNKEIQKISNDSNDEYENDIHNINENNKPKIILNDINNNLYNNNNNIEENKIKDEISNQNKIECNNDNYLNNPNLNNVNKPIEVPKIEILNNNITNDKIKPLIDVKKNNNLTRIVNKRNDDLQKFILFTNNLNFPYNIPQKETKRIKTTYQKPKVQINLNNNDGQDINLNDYHIEKYIKINENNVYPKTISKDIILSNNFIINDVNKKN